MTTPSRPMLRADLGRRAILYSGASLLVLSLTGLSAGAQAQPTLGPLTDISGASIFASCTADKVGQQVGTNYPNTVVEFSLAIAPRNPSSLLLGMQQDRWSNGGSRGQRAEYSSDGGNTFAAASTRGVSKCQGGPWPRSSDPWVSFWPNGTALFSELVTAELPNPNAFGHNGQTVSRSVDGGKTWQPPTVLVDTPYSSPPNPQTLNDKNAVTADYHNGSQYAYVVWDQLTSYTPGYGVNDERGGNDCGHPNCDDQHDGLSIARHYRQHPISPAAAAGAAPAPKTFVTGPSLLSRTLDGGNTWSAPKVIFDPGSNFQTIGNQVLVLNNTLADVFTQQNDLSGADQIGFIYSSDLGATWSAANLAFSLVAGDSVTPNTQTHIRSADIIPSATYFSAGNLLIAAWQDTQFSGVPEIALAYSQSNGFTWSPTIHVNQTPRTSNISFEQALIPAITETPDGTIIVTYYDFRNDTPGATTDLADYWAVFCNPFTSADGCTSNGDWSTELRLTGSSFDWNLAPYANGLFLGDYMGLKSTGQTAWAAFGQPVGPQMTDLFVRSITVPTAATAASE